MDQIRIKEKKIFKKKKVQASSHLIKSQITKLKRLSRIISKQVPCYTFEYVTQNLQEKLNNRKPFKIIKVPSMFGSPNNVEEQISRLLEGQNSLDISVSENNKFSGHYTEHKTISLSFDDFLDYKGPYNFYLAQLPLYEKQTIQNTPSQGKFSVLNQNNIQEKNEQNLQKLFQFDSNFKTFCSRFKNAIQRINLWFSKKETFSSLHYDFYDNFLFMLKGKKVFYVSPPDDENIACESVLTNSFQQAKSFNKTKPRYKITLRENEAIFLPQGWFHEVASTGDENIIAINIWFNSIEDICAEREKYLLRYLIANRIEKEIKTLMTTFKDSLIDTKLHPNEDITIILQEFRKDQSRGIKLFLTTLYNTPNSSIRAFILKILLADPETIQQIFLALDNHAVEYLTKRLEEVDSIPPNLLHSNNKDGNSPTIDEFYTALHQKLEYQSVMNHFIKCKKLLRKKVLKNVLYNKLAHSYKF